MSDVNSNTKPSLTSLPSEILVYIVDIVDAFHDRDAPHERHLWNLLLVNRQFRDLVLRVCFRADPACWTEEKWDENLNLAYLALSPFFGKHHEKKMNEALSAWHKYRASEEEPAYLKAVRVQQREEMARKDSDTLVSPSFSRYTYGAVTVLSCGILFGICRNWLTALCE